jgi:beta-1,4-N-acetylglucosaminyltransferase
MVWYIIYGIIGWYILRYFYLVTFPSTPSQSLMIILGSGGHTTEMLSILKSLNLSKFSIIHIVQASSDKTSLPKLYSEFPSLPNTVQTHSFFRSRRVGQSYFSSIFTTLYSFLPAFLLIWRTSPGLILTNGPGTCIPLCFSAYFLRVLLVSRTSLFYIESFCRVRTLSLSGKLMYRIADTFYVQWSELCSRYPRAKYVGMLV